LAIPECQAEVAAFLRALTGRDPVETHISAVFVGAHEVLKLKKAVRLPFLDFTALSARAAMARRELALNRVAAPDIYRGVQAVVRDSNGALHLAPEDAPGAVEYVVRMARVPEADFLDAIAARGGLDSHLLDALGDAVAELHAKLPPVRDFDSPGSMRWIIEGNAKAARAAGLAEPQVRDWLHATLAELDRVAPALQARAEAGFVRRAHGDLHLGNMCLWQGKPTAFDILEFDDALATIDTGYDLAFLLMDLEFHTGREAANRVMNRYIARTGDIGLASGLPCFLSTRAVVRAHVQASRGEPDQAARYLEQAFAALQKSEQRLVAIGGLQGTGKSTLARALAPSLGRAPGALVLRSDEVRKRLHGVAPEEKLPPAAYDEAANAKLNAALLEAAAAALRTGQAVITDCTFLHATLRGGIESVAREAGVKFLGLWLEADLNTLLERVAARQGDASDAGPEVLRQAAAQDYGAITWHRINAADPDAAKRKVEALARAPQH
jgi:aminoglycoside phosphotransferase family enzyme/predicted kinase